MIQLTAIQSQLTAIQPIEPIVAGSVEVHTCTFTLNDDWDGLNKVVATFKAGNLGRTVELSEENAAVIPWEVTQSPGNILYVGLYGITTEGAKVLPTNWVNLGRILAGASPMDPPQAPTPSVYQEIFAAAQGAETAAQNAQEIAQSVRDDADAGKFDGKQGPQGDPGQAATISVGSVTTGDPGTDATVENVGTSTDAVLNFTIPRGAVGATGAQGEQGIPGEAATIAVGTVTTGTPETPADVTNVGTENAAVFDFVIPQGPPGKDGVQINDDAINGTEAWSSLKIVDTLCPPFTVTGNPAVCNPVDGYPLSVSVEIVPQQAGTGDPSPENVRPINGFENLDFTISGKNLFNGALVPTGDQYDVTLSFDPETQTFLMNGKTSRLNGIYFSFFFQTIIPIVDAMTITVEKISGEIIVPDGGYAVAYLGQGDTAEESINSPLSAPLSGGSQKSSSFSKKYLTRFWFFLTDGVEITNLKFQIQVNYNNFTVYSPYQGQSITIPLNQTVYGGTLNVISGQGESTWGYIASYNGETLPGEWISDRDVYAPGTSPTIGSEVAYALTDPVPFLTEPQEILALSGVNTLYADTGDVTVSGRSDPTAYIQQQISDAITAAVAITGGT